MRILESKGNSGNQERNINVFIIEVPESTSFSSVFAGYCDLSLPKLFEMRWVANININKSLYREENAVFYHTAYLTSLWVNQRKDMKDGPIAP